MELDLPTVEVESRFERECLLASAKLGGGEAIGELLKLYTRHLRILAETQLDCRLRARVSPSDVVQETLLAAHRGLPQFRGQTEAEFLTWLRKILANNLARAVEFHVVAEKRHIHREVSIEQIGASLERSAARFQYLFVDAGASPSAQANEHERLLAVSEAMAELPEDYRRVILLRHVEGLSFQNVAREMGRSAGACRMVWLRAIEQIRARLSHDGWL